METLQINMEELLAQTNTHHQTQTKQALAQDKEIVALKAEVSQMEVQHKETLQALQTQMQTLKAEVETLKQETQQQIQTLHKETNKPIFKTLLNKHMAEVDIALRQEAKIYYV